MKKTENIISNALKFHADAIEASPVMKEKIDQAILKQNTVFKKERSTSMKWNFKKVAVAALGVCLLTGGVCYAGSKVAYYASVGNTDDYQASFSALSSLEEEAGINVSVVETFANGYTFDSAATNNTSAYSEEDQELFEFQEIVIRYKNGDLPGISVYAEDAVYLGDEETIPDMVRECDGIEIRYVSYVNKFVPADYELTDEDKANMENPNFNLAYGASEVEIKQGMFVNWEKDGVHYNMLGFDLPLSAEEMLDMAEEMIRAE